MKCLIPFLFCFPTHTHHHVHHRHHYAHHYISHHRHGVIYTVHTHTKSAVLKNPTLKVVPEKTEPHKQLNMFPGAGSLND